METSQILRKMFVGFTALIILGSCNGIPSPGNDPNIYTPVELDTGSIPETSKGRPTMTSEPLEATQTQKTLADADVLYVKAVFENQSWTFYVTISHPDIGWDDYVNGWDVVIPGGNVLKVNESDSFTRLLLHPHENEQPFTRSQSGIIIPEGTSMVHVRAHDLIDGFGGKEIIVDLSQKSGDGYEIIR